MKKIFRSKTVWALIIAVAIVVVIGVTAIIMGGSGILGSAVNGSTKPVQTVIDSAINWLEEIYGYMYSFNDLKEENESLKKQVEKLTEQVESTESLSEENKRLRNLLSFSEKRSEFTYESVNIISQSASNWNRFYTVNKGSSSGLEKNQVVVDEYGYVVGQITELGLTWATVQMISDTRTEVGAQLQNSGVSAVLEGDFTLMQNGQAKLSYIPSGTNVQIGESVLTSGEGGIYPRGLVLGTVNELIYEESGLSVYAIVDCATDFETLHQIFVITDYKITD